MGVDGRSVPATFRPHSRHTVRVLGGVIRTLMIGPRLVQSILVLPELLRRIEEIERHTDAMVGNTGNMDRSTAALATKVPELVDLSKVVAELQISLVEMERSVQLLTQATQPLGRLAGRLPGGRRSEALP
jgi:hypothetical protein